MDVEIRPVSPEEFQPFHLAVERAFGVHPRPEEEQEHRRVFEADRTLAAFDGSDIVGTAAAYTLTLTVPGNRLPMAGVTAVGVTPTHRRRGLLTAMMRRQLDDVRDRGEALAGLWASEGSIYQRFGYGLAAFSTNLRILRERTAFARPWQPDGRLTLLEKAEALDAFPPIHERVSAVHPGMWSRTPAWWKVHFADLEHWREGYGALFFALHEGSDGPDGYVAYRVKHDWPEGTPEGGLQVTELMAENARAYGDLWRFCFDHDLVKEIRAWGRQADEPLLLMLAEPRRLRLQLQDGLWLRPVDLPGALAARRYVSEGRLVLEVRDPFCPWNEGRYELEGGPDGAECRRTRKGADVLMDASDVGAAYLGGVRFGTLARAGRVDEERPGALARADALFAWEPLPWCPSLF